jgi:DNA recombination protein RmuC
MDPALAVLLGLLLGHGLGYVVALVVMRLRAVGAGCGHEDPRIADARHDAELAAVRAEEQRTHAELRSELSGLEATAEGLRQQVATAQHQYRDLHERVHTDERARAERDRVESRVLQALSPVQETLRTMQLKVDELESQRVRQHGELTEQLKTAAESDERLRATTESLASALRNNSTRGVWGETQLRNVVEAAGLTNRVDFVLQSSITTDAGAGRPDMIVRLPGGKAIAVDSKVPYNSYLEASRIPATATGEEEARRNALLGQHAKQVKNHIDALAGKRYWEGLTASPEFTVAFIPSESLLAAALEHDPLLLEYAFSRRIALASPVNLWAVLKTVALTWQQDVLTEDAKRLFDLSKELYSRLATLGEHADKLRRSIDSTVTNWNRFASSLETRVLVTARKLDELDPSKVLGEPSTLDARPTTLSAVELDYDDTPELENTPAT